MKAACPLFSSLFSSFSTSASFDSQPCPCYTRPLSNRAVSCLSGSTGTRHRKEGPVNTTKPAWFAPSETNRPLFLVTLAVCLIWLLLASAANGIASLQPPPRLPPLFDNPADRLRGAQLKPDVWLDPYITAWKQIDEFPRWGGNVFRLMLTPFADGKPILPGRPLTERLAKALERFETVIDWALQHNMHLIIAPTQSGWPPPAD